MLLLFMIVGLGSAWADEVKVLYTLDTTLSASKGSNSAYDGNCDVTVDKITWNVAGNATMAPWRIGGKSITDVDRVVYSKTAYSSKLTKVSLEIGAASVTINSIKLIHSTNSDFSEATTIKASGTSASTTYNFEQEGGFPEKSYYKFVFNVTVSGGSNKFIEFKNVKFYGQDNGTTPETPTTYGININNITGGTISASSASATEGSEVTLTATPDDGYEFSSWYVLDGNGDEITVVDNKFTMPASDVEVSATFTQIQQEDTYSYYFKKIESEADLVDGGEYIIVKEEKESAYAAGYLYDAKNFLSVNMISTVGEYIGKVNGEGLPYVYTLKDDGDGGFYIISNNKYLTGVSGKTDLKFVDSSTEYSRWKCTVTGYKNVTIQNKTATYGTNNDYRQIRYSTGSPDRFADYGLTTGSAVTLYKKITSLTITLNPACTDDEFVYSTFSSSRPFIVPDGLIVSEIAIVGDELLVDSYDTGDIVPANRGVMVSAEKGGDYEVEIADAEMAELAESVLGDDNFLRPSGDAGITATEMAEKDPNCTYFRLTMHEGTQIGYWWGAEEGAAFGLAANKAYLAVPNTASVKSNLWFGKDATSISVPAVKAEDATIYNLAGQRVSATTKGIYIKNGKKLFVK